MEECFIHKNIWNKILLFCDVESMYVLQGTCTFLNSLVKSQKEMHDYQKKSLVDRILDFRPRIGGPRLLLHLLKTAKIDVALDVNLLWHVTQINEKYDHFESIVSEIITFLFTHSSDGMLFKSFLSRWTCNGKPLPDTCWSVACKHQSGIWQMIILQNIFSTGMKFRHEHLLAWAVRMGVHFEGEHAVKLVLPYQGFASQKQILLRRYLFPSMRQEAMETLIRLLRSKVHSYVNRRALEDVQEEYTIRFFKNKSTL